MSPPGRPQGEHRATRPEATPVSELLVKLRGGPRTPMLMQGEMSECGLACLGMVAGYFGRDIDLVTLRARYPVTSRGMTMAEMDLVSRSLGLEMSAFKLELEFLPKLRLPAVLHWEMNHFVVLVRLTKNKAVLHDPVRGIVRVTRQELNEKFTGIAAQFAPSQDFKPGSERNALTLASLVRGLPGHRGLLAKLIGTALLVEICAVILPMFMQSAVDSVVPTGDKGLLWGLITGFALLGVYRVVATLGKAWVAMTLAANITVLLKHRVFDALLRLPLTWFAQRGTATVHSQFQSTGQVRNLFSQGVLGSLVDIPLMLVLATVMLVYQWQLALLVLLLSAIGAALHGLLVAEHRSCTQSSIRADGKEAQVFMETVRGIQAVKLYGRERQQMALWKATMSQAANQTVSLLRVRALDEVATVALSAMESILVVGFGVYLLLEGSMTLGALFAFQAFRADFAARLRQLYANYFVLKSASVHIEHLGDVMQSTPEAEPSPDLSVADNPCVEFRGVSFRHGPHARWVFKDLSFEVRPGEIVALTGPSGCGKTTALQLLLGIARPQAGDILVDGQSLLQLPAASFRQHVATVMQEDYLFTGSVLDNIAFFDPEVDVSRVQVCAQQAGIDDEILAMPMKYETLLSESLHVVSGGQRQRILIARALYRDAKLLLMDEATSHLDYANEKSIAKVLRSLGKTVLIVAHRQETLAGADRVVHIT